MKALPGYQTGIQILKKFLPETYVETKKKLEELRKRVRLKRRFPEMITSETEVKHKVVKLA